VVIGKAEVRAVFKIGRLGNIAGSVVREGELRRNAKARVIRQGAVVFEGDVSSLKHNKDDVREVQKGFECGIGLKDFDDFKVGDILEFFTTELV
jgi:translation initiation factor IF-2